MTNEERKNYYMNRNIRLLPMYIALVWDVFFIKTISVMFYTNVKGLTYSQTVMLDSICMFAGFLLCIPVTKLFSKWSSVVVTRLGLLGYAIFLLLIILGKSFIIFSVAQVFLAFGYVSLAIKNNTLLADSLHSVKRDKEYSRVNGLGVSIYHVFESVGAIVITYVYSYNPYLAYWISFSVVMLTILYSCLLKDPNKFVEKNVDIAAKQVKESETKKSDSYKKILSSGFALTLLIFIFLFRGVGQMDTTVFKIYLQNLVDFGTLPVWAFGYIFGAMRLIVALASKYQFKFDLKFSVKSLVFFNVALFLTYLISGLLIALCPQTPVIITIVVILFFIMCSLNMPTQLFIDNYVQVCVTKKNVEKMNSLKVMLLFLGRSLIPMVYAALLPMFNDNVGWTNIVYISIFIIPLFVSMILFIKLLIKKYTQKYTIIKDEYTID